MKTIEILKSFNKNNVKDETIKEFAEVIDNHVFIKNYHLIMFNDWSFTIVYYTNSDKLAQIEYKHYRNENFGRAEIFINNSWNDTVLKWEKIAKLKIRSGEN